MHAPAHPSLLTSSTRHGRRAVAIGFATLAAMHIAAAQGPVAAPAAPPVGAASAALPAASGASVSRDSPVLDRHTQRVEHIHVEDKRTRVDEVRVGGQTQSITVQPKNAAPAYDVQPADPTGVNTSREAAPGGTGPRVWKLREF